MKLPKVSEYPKEVFIKGSVWKLFFKRCIDNNQDDLGLCDASEKELFIKLGQIPRERLATFIHELIHAFEEEYDFDLPHPIVYKLEKAIVAFLLDNF